MNEFDGLDGSADFDPDVAQKFELLDRVEPPALSLDPSSTRSQVAADPMAGNTSPERRYLVPLAAAAATVILAISAVALTGGSDKRVETADDGEASAALQSDTRSSGDDGENGDASAAEEEAPSDEMDDGTATPDEEAEADEAGTSTAPALTVEPKPTTSSIRTTTTEAEATTTTPVEETTTTPTTEKTTTTVAEAMDVVVLRGVVSEVMTDCVGNVYLDPNGEIVNGPVLCDGGSYVVVDGTRVQTSAGYTFEEFAFNKHDPDIRPGQKVSVTAGREGGSNGPLSLRCETCQIRRG